LKEWVLSIKIFPFLRALAHRLPVLEAILRTFFE
jgi:hypothetical protein